MMPSFDLALLKRQQAGNLRQLYLHPDGIDLASNDYLGLSRSSRLLEKTLQEWEKGRGLFNGLGSTGSRLFTGNFRYTEELEAKIAAFHGYESATLFGCGYMANVGLFTVISGAKDTILFDTHIHASTRDGIMLSRSKSLPFRHNQVEHLEQRLKNFDGRGNCFICVESIYSTNGSKAPLKEICTLAINYGAYVIVDEAHAVGVYGPQGKGMVAELNLMDKVLAQIVTFGKALGSYGAAILGRKKLQQMLINFARSYVYTTALPLLSLAAIKSAYDLLPSLEKERSHLLLLIRAMQALAGSNSPTHIHSLEISGNQLVKEAAKFFVQQGIHVSPLMSPTVQKGREGLRINLHAFNTEAEMNHLANVFKTFKRLYHA